MKTKTFNQRKRLSNLHNRLLCCHNLDTKAID